MGRKKILSEEAIKKFADAIYLGARKNLAAKYIGASVSAVMLWQNMGLKEREARENGGRPNKNNDVYLKFLEAIEQAQTQLGIELLQEIQEARGRGDVASSWRMLERLEGEDKPEAEEAEENGGAKILLPAELISPDFLSVWRSILAGGQVEYCLDGGRGSTKSSFIALAIVVLLLANKDWNALIVRQVAHTLKSSVYNQVAWAIDRLSEYYPRIRQQFKMTLNPLEITYMPTGQRIFFRGADDPLNLKSIKPQVGHIALLWFEEFDQFRGEEQVRSIVQSALRGGDVGYRFQTWNTPRSRQHWTNKYLEIPRENRLHHHSTYLTAPAEWLGKVFIEEAEYLKSVNPAAYEHEYLGVANSTGGQVFENVEVRGITDEEIARFDNPRDGIDWGYYPDPFVWSRSYYSPRENTLYIYDEFRGYKLSNRDAYDAIASKLRPNIPITADSAEPKSIADFSEFGAPIRGADKGPDSVEYMMRWLQSRVKIVIDPVRCPYHAQEFLSYEYLRTRDGEIISGYPDRDNHTIDAVRYAHNEIWMRRIAERAPNIWS